MTPRTRSAMRFRSLAFASVSSPPSTCAIAPRRALTVSRGHVSPAIHERVPMRMQANSSSPRRASISRTSFSVTANLSMNSQDCCARPLSRPAASHSPSLYSATAFATATPILCALSSDISSAQSLRHSVMRVPSSAFNGVRVMKAHSLSTCDISSFAVLWPASRCFCMNLQRLSISLQMLAAPASATIA